MSFRIFNVKFETQTIKTFLCQSKLRSCMTLRYWKISQKNMRIITGIWMAYWTHLLSSWPDHADKKILT